MGASVKYMSMVHGGRSSSWSANGKDSMYGSSLEAIVYYLSRILPNTNHDSLIMYFRDSDPSKYANANSLVASKTIDKILKERHY